MASRCIHVNILGDYTHEDIRKKQQVSKCDSCSSTGPYLWVCMHYDCLYIGCEEPSVDHSTQHFKDYPEHCLTLNLTSLRLWCYLCECEVFLENNIPPVRSTPRKIRTPNVSVANADPDTDEENLDEDHSLKPRGLTGLQNIGNTCYMNSAIQALSNCPPLTQFFLDCAAFIRTDKKPGLSKNYMKLMMEMWHKRRPSYVVPSNIAYGIKLVCPMFRGYTQQDSQEFLRCFMDQLHEELKEPIREIPNSNESPTSPIEIDLQIDNQDSTEDSSQSEAEYETCDSGLSSEKSSCSEETGMLIEQGPSYQKDSAFASGFNGLKGTVRNKVVYSHRGGMGGNRETRVAETHQQRVREVLTCSQQHGYQSLPSRQKRIYPKPDWVAASAESSDAMSDSTAIGDSTAMLSSRPSSPVQSLPDKPVPKQHLLGLSASAPQIKVAVPHVAATKFHSQQTVGPQTQVVISSQMKSGRKKKQTKYRSIVSDVFDGKILSSVQCLTCDRVSSTKETFQDLSLPIPNREYLGVLHASQSTTSKGAMSTCTDVYSNQGWLSWVLDWMKSWFWGPTVSLQDCLSAFFSADELKGDNMYSCEKCKKLRNGIKYSKVLYLPEILCIHLKRFRHEVMFSSKIGSYVSFPLEDLDLQPFLHKDCPSTVTTYDLVAVICHHGTAGGGHYTSYALNCINDQWYEFDDQYVTEVDPQTVANCEAYVLFYRKVSEQMMKKRQRAVELMEISKREPSLMQFYISKQWVNKFNTFAEPGPIDNTDFLCPHGGVHPYVSSHVNELCTVLSQGVWEYLHDSFRGGPPCTRLYLCSICQNELETLERRRKQELEQFIHLREFMTRSSIYAISMSWFRTWESFVKGKENELPGPIDNSSIAVNKGGQVVLKIGSEYATLSEELWQFLYNIYGGGPELNLQNPASGDSHPTASSMPPASSYSVGTNGPAGGTGSKPRTSAPASHQTVASCAEKCNAKVEIQPMVCETSRETVDDIKPSEQLEQKVEPMITT